MSALPEYPTERDRERFRDITKAMQFGLEYDRRLATNGDYTDQQTVAMFRLWWSVERERQLLQNLNQSQGCKISELLERAEKAEAELARMAKQEPVAFWWIGEGGENHGGPYRGMASEFSIDNARNSGCSPQYLYAGPVPAVAAGLPAIGPYRDFIPAPAAITSTSVQPDDDTRRNDEAFAAYCANRAVLNGAPGELVEAAPSVPDILNALSDVLFESARPDVPAERLECPDEWSDEHKQTFSRWVHEEMQNNARRSIIKRARTLLQSLDAKESLTTSPAELLQSEVRHD